MALAITIGFPRTGSKRQAKLALESFWKGKSSEAELLAAFRAVDAEAWGAQRAAGVSRVALDGTHYDQVLDMVAALGAAPARFKHLSGLDLYFAMARGAPGAPALDMSKFFDSNYHFMVPELDEGFTPRPDFAPILDRLARGQATLGKDAAVPMLIGPVTFALLASTPLLPSAVVARILPAYAELLAALAGAGAPEVQLHEPALATDRGAAARAEYEAAYRALSGAGCPINLVATYDDLGEAYPWAVRLPVASLTLDFCGVPGAAIPNATLALVEAHGWPAGKRLGVGCVDGRSVWADDEAACAALLARLRAAGAADLAVTSSVSLQHLPWDITAETALPAKLAPRLAFAVQKLAAIARLASGAVAPASGASWGAAPVDSVQEIPRSMFDRAERFEERRAKQLQFPPFPTTSIGSFPQTAQVRRLRAQLKSGALDRPAYEALIDRQIALAVGIQEGLDVDVLVHGEAERTDMSEHFGMQLSGMVFTTNGWVQSYGSRYVRPPIIAGDVAFVAPMTVREFKVAQDLTSRPVKGMLTGPVTILNWSFPRKDLSRRAQAFQLALALRKEVAALEEAGCRIVQVDEPALREGLPLKSSKADSYLSWAVDAFRLCTTVAAPSTQVVTHLCYSDFGDIMQPIIDMDADVLTIENSRSGDAMVRALAAAGYTADLGPASASLTAQDRAPTTPHVHSPVVPDAAFLEAKLRSFLDTGILAGAPERLWVNPDCGLKTRAWEEVIPSLRNMVAAAHKLRAEVLEKRAGGPPAAAKAAVAASSAVAASAGAAPARSRCAGAGCC
ncbi:hypothetical protein Rsub_05036 [Raphidocelis subcapitata]|uniref:5-methyltetrahydropteroyltriglutamate--homocysteine S-methyltransferase n=1 Tax=Raphidocelis subcapitata TaxID=307507 RepID=A0A2V0P662_9CHLO|nr:hypothetical protein Rsub_05036 [Raphidocelis subcapitata]|eukprot:GBF92667.1 hypothetical protein Rsub_05036 [Raphidocelis subcapitata]